MKIVLRAYSGFFKRGSHHFRISLFLGLLFLFSLLFPQPTLYSHVDHPKEEKGIGIDEKLGQVIPLDLTFRDETDHPVPLKKLIGHPTILALVYYSCPDVCSFLLHNLAGTLTQLLAEPGKEYGVVAVSFDETEKPELAREKKKLYLSMIEKPFPEDAWSFLTGDQENIQKLADSVGFRFKREGKAFQHPVALIVLSPNGKITRYLYGMEFLPFDLKMAILEASEGRVGPTISKVLRFCFSYDPKGRKYVFNTLKVTGIVTFICGFAK
ncbi:MAG: SCO family protein, partial [Deltaproteobacteria bacterium]|nr:SCO family protein [Deltaproteobacteria bacterium]